MRWPSRRTHQNVKPLGFLRAGRARSENVAAIIAFASHSKAHGRDSAVIRSPMCLSREGADQHATQSTMSAVRRTPWTVYYDGACEVLGLVIETVRAAYEWKNCLWFARSSEQELKRFSATSLGMCLSHDTKLNLISMIPFSLPPIPTVHSHSQHTYVPVYDARDSSASFASEVFDFVLRS